MVQCYGEDEQQRRCERPAEANPYWCSHHGNQAAATTLLDSNSARIRAAPGFAEVRQCCGEDEQQRRCERPAVANSNWCSHHRNQGPGIGVRGTSGTTSPQGQGVAPQGSSVQHASFSSMSAFEEYVRTTFGYAEGEEIECEIFGQDWIQQETPQDAQYRLQPKPGSDIPDSLTACNLDDIVTGRAACRQLLSNFEIVVLDGQDNLVNNNITGPVRMHIETSEGGVSEPGMPRLESSSMDGYLLAERTRTGTFLFPDTSLRAECGSTEGTYKLVVDSAGDNTIDSWGTSFFFTSGLLHLERIRDAEDALAALTIELNNHRKILATAEDEMQHALNTARTKVDRLPSNFSNEFLAVGDYTAWKGLAKQQRDNLFAWYLRAKQHQNLPQRISERVQREIGRVRYIVELGFVQDPTRAKILSQCVGTMMRGVYVDTKEYLRIVQNANGCGLCPQTVRTFNVQGKTRNSSQMGERKLPLPTLAHAGFNGYLVNMIELPIQNEDLRDTLFWTLFGNTVMFDTKANASRYLASLQPGQASLLFRVEEDGSVGRNGHLFSSDILEEPGIVFNSTMHPKYHANTRTIHELDEIIPALTFFDNMALRVSERKREYDEVCRNHQEKEHDARRKRTRF